MATTHEHPAFIRAKALSDPDLRAHFPKSADEAQAFEPMVLYRALHSNVLVVARTRIETAWAAYVAPVNGRCHEDELEGVLRHGVKVDEDVARVLFPILAEVPYAE